MAERAGYSTTALSQAAAGDQLPSPAVVRAYAEALVPTRTSGNGAGGRQTPRSGRPRRTRGRRTGGWPVSSPATVICSSAGRRSSPTWWSWCASTASRRCSGRPAAASPRCCEQG
ncbi:helix-turn-helix domain-containing protein [Streptomyces sp. MMG1533]|uniref:helix-turn-helix domain-containing protein n=1 Tax=Streptomyces sp. MMG1533 TaxID=1415546 RepID=UPI001F401ADE